MVLNGELEIGELTAFLLYLGAFFTPIQTLTQLYNGYQQGQAAVAKLRDLLETSPSVTELPDAQPLPDIEGSIVFEDVNFAYVEDNPVLKNINFKIQTGETIAIVGPTGGGKSTVAKLATRFYDPSSGRVLIDGYDIRNVQLESLRKQIGVVPQEPFLFAGSIRENVGFSRPEASDDEIIEALDASGLMPMVDSLPDGIDTVIHERGASLCGQTTDSDIELFCLNHEFLF